MGKYYVKKFVEKRGKNSKAKGHFKSCRLRTWKTPQINNPVEVVVEMAATIVTMTKLVVSQTHSPSGAFSTVVMIGGPNEGRFSDTNVCDVNR